MRDVRESFPIRDGSYVDYIDEVSCIGAYVCCVLNATLRAVLLASFESSKGTSPQHALVHSRSPLRARIKHHCTHDRSDNDRVRALRKHARESVLKQGAKFGMGIDRNPAGTSRNL